MCLSRQEMWDKAYGLLCEFIEKYGRLCSSGERYKDFQLGYWLSFQRKLYDNGKLSDERYVRLQAVGVFDEEGRFVELDEKNEIKWKKMYNLLKQYVQDKGFYPLKTSEMYKGVDLGDWCTAQRIRYKQGKMVKERYELLDKIGFPFRLQDYKFVIKAEQLKDYIDENGTSIKAKGETQQLALFYKRLKSDYRTNQLQADRKELVDRLGILIDTE